MKTFALILLILFCSCIAVNAQSKMSAGIRAIVALPMGSFGDVTGTGFGAQGTYEVGFGNNIAAIGQVGYIKWGGKDVGDYSYNYSAVPVLLGVKYYLTPGSDFYVNSSVGFHFFSVSSDIPTFTIGGTTIGGGSASANSTDFTFIAGAGYEIPLNKKISLDFGGAYNLISDANYITIHAGGKIGL
jgi:hypothetical protein